MIIRDMYTYNTYLYLYIYIACVCVCVKSFSGVSTAWTITFGRPAKQDLQRLIFMHFDKAWFPLSCCGIVGITQKMMINKTKMHMIKSIRSRYTWLSIYALGRFWTYLEMESVFHTQLSRRQVQRYIDPTSVSLCNCSHTIFHYLCIVRSYVQLCEAWSCVMWSTQAITNVTVNCRGFDSSTNYRQLASWPVCHVCRLRKKIKWHFHRQTLFDVSILPISFTLW